MKIAIFTLSSLFLFSNLFSQESKDSTRILQEITVKAYLSEQPLLGLPSSAVVINPKQIQQSSIHSLVPVLNTISGVKMEERSPGSYRISIRGSLLRSPFGVRNIKVYYDDFPFTDAGGNTYFNLIDQSAISNMEILKGPDGSLFGANSGGVILVNTQAKANEISLNLGAGSYGFARQNFSVNQNKKNFDFNIHQTVQLSDGYRDHSQLKKYFFQTQEKWRYAKNSTLKFSSFYSDLGYETPGGLNAAQFESNPQAARPRVGNTPGAEEQKAAIYNKTFFGGLAHEIQITPKLKHVISISGINTNFENPFITNYEKRKEHSFAVRTYFELKNKQAAKLKFQWNTGWEFQKTNTDIRNYGNNKGQTTTILAADRIENQQQFVFTRLALQSGKHFKAEISNSLNFAGYSFETLPESNSAVVTGSQNLKTQWMPRLGLSYLINNQIALRGIISKGFSTPTTAEIRASDAKINTDLKSENGWNYELGMRLRTPFESIYLDISAFYYRLNDAIVRRVNANDQDFFVNAGGTNQKGVEIALQTKIISNKTGFIKNLDFNNALTLNDFKFRDYTIGSNNFSGNLLTGVPKINWNSNVDLELSKGFNLYGQYQFNGKTSLNDAASVFADSYHLVMVRLSWQKQIQKANLSLNIGADNILNEKYSLGNDLNAFGTRFFNAAADRNYFVGLGIRL